MQRLALPLMLLSAQLACADPAPERAPAPEPITPSREHAAEQAPSDLVLFTVDAPSSEVDFLMEAPLEDIHGRAPGALEGTLRLDLEDLSRSTAVVRVDLERLEVLQRKRETPEAPLGDEVRDARQNAHLKTWLQISEDAPAPEREANRWATLRVTRVDEIAPADGTRRRGPALDVALVAHGTLRLHGIETPAEVPLRLHVAYEQGRPRAVDVRTARPLSVSLETHRIEPRSAFDRLAERTLAMLGQKVAPVAPVTARFTARPR